MANNPVSTHPLGQIRDDVVEELGGAAKDIAKTVVNEPAKILEQILGGVTTNQPQQNTPKDPLIEQRQQAAKADDEALYKLHQQRLQEEIAFHAQSKQKVAEEKQVEKQEEARDQQIVQLKREKEDEALWQQQIKSVQGSHESQQGKM